MSECSIVRGEYMEIGSKIKKLRLREGFTQEKLAEQLGVSFQTISKWENSVCMPDIEMLPKISILFGITIDELFSITAEQRLHRIENMLDDERELPYSIWQDNVDFLKEQQNTFEDKGKIYDFLAHMYHHRMVSDSEYVEEYVRKTLIHSPNCADAQWLLEKACGAVNRDFCEKNHHRVIELFNSIISSNPDVHERTYFALLDNLIDDNRLKDAEDILEKYAGTKNPSKLRILIYNARIADKKHDINLADELRNKIETEYGEDELALYELANVAAFKCDYYKAIDYFERSFNKEHKPRFVDALKGIEICYDILGDVDAANQCRKRQIDVYEEDWGVEGGEIIESVKRRMR